MRIFLDTPDVKKAKERVFEKVRFYTKAVTRMTVETEAKKEHEREVSAILKWILPDDQGILPPKEDNPEACQWFLTSKEYKFWIGEGPSVLICTGQRMFFLDCFHC